MEGTGAGKARDSAVWPGGAEEARTPSGPETQGGAGPAAGAAGGMPGSGTPASGGRSPGTAQSPHEQGQAEQQGFERQRFDPQDQPPAGVKDDANIAGEKDFELKPPGGG